MKGSRLAASVLLGILVTIARMAPAAPAPKAQARDHYNRGRAAYAEKRYREAMEEFKRTYELDPNPILLYNIAQSHRSLGQREEALSYFRRFVEQADPGKTRTQAEAYIQEMTAQLDAEGATAPPAPSGEAARVPAATPAPSSAMSSPDQWTPGAAAALEDAGEGRADSWALDASTALRLPGYPGANVSGTAIAVFSLGLARSLGPGPIDLAVGGQLSFSPLSYRTSGGVAATDETTHLLGIHAQLWGRKAFDETFGLRWETGAGVVRWGKLVDRNPFTEGDKAASGEMMASAFLGLAGEARLSRAWRAHLGTRLVLGWPVGGTLQLSRFQALDLLGAVSLSF